MGLQKGKKSAGRSVLLWFFLYPAVENIPGGIIFYRGPQTSHTRAEVWKITLFSNLSSQSLETDFSLPL
jgi:hypothetical protein